MVVRRRVKVTTTKVVTPGGVLSVSRVSRKENLLKFWLRRLRARLGKK